MTSGGRVPAAYLALGVLALVALWLLRSALAPFFVAVVLAYLLEPLVAVLARRTGRDWAALLVILASLGLVTLLVWLLVPGLVGQAERLLDALPGLWGRAEARWTPFLQGHPWLAGKVRAGLAEVDPMAVARGVGLAGAGLLGWFLQAVSLILVPLFLYYLLVEGPALGAQAAALVPPRYLAEVQALANEVHRRLGGYIRGQLAVSVVMAVLQGLTFQLLGVPYPWLLGVLAGAFNVVPYSPYLVAMVPALVLEALGGAGTGRLLLVAGLFTGVQKIETVFFTPVWVGRGSGLHPLEVLLAVLCFGYAFGFLGLIFAVPLMIVFKVAAGELLRRYRALPWFRAEG